GCLHEGVVGRVRVGILTKLLELVPCRLGVGRAELGHHRACVGGIEEALKEAVLQSLRTGRKAELRRAGLFGDVLGPFDQLVVGDGVEIDARGQILQRLLVGRHQIGGLHPWHVFLLAGAEQNSTCWAWAPPTANDSAIAAHATFLNMVFILLFLPGWAPSCRRQLLVRGAAPWLALGTSVGRISLVSGSAVLSAMTVSSISAISRAHWRIEASKVVRPGGA